jgi:hypothetical protein
MIVLARSTTIREPIMSDQKTTHFGPPSRAVPEARVPPARERRRRHARPDHLARPLSAATAYRAAPRPDPSLSVRMTGVGPVRMTSGQTLVGLLLDGCTALL